MYQEILLAVIVSVDTFLAAAAYCNSGIKIPAISAVVINIIGASVLGLSLLLSDIISSFISAELCRILGFIVITAIGTVTVFKSLIRALVGRLSENGGLSLKTGSIVIKLYLDDTAADMDNSKTLSASEAAALALASSFDSAATGLSCGAADISPLRAAFFTFAAGFAAIALGGLSGKKISSADHDLSWLGGLLLIGFAVFEFVR